jgi:hypothetical protein
MIEESQVTTRLSLKTIIWIIKLVMILLFLSFSFLPLAIASFTLLLEFYSNNIRLQILVLIILLSFGFMSLFGIITSNLKIRFLGVGFFSLGIVFSFTNPYLLSLGIVVSWVFYEIWYLISQYDQFIWDYDDYPKNSFETQKLNKIFYNQFISLGTLAWIALSISWLALFISSNYYIELGFQFGTLGISISIAMILIFYLINKLFVIPSRKEKN